MPEDQGAGSSLNDIVGDGLQLVDLQHPLDLGEQSLHYAEVAAGQSLDRILRPGGDIAEDITVLDPGGDQGVVLKCRILTDGGYPGVAQQSHTHHHASLNPSMEEGGTLFGETGW